MYLLHEPLLAKFREHKTFAKKLARALGRGEWALAKGLEDRKPVARLDHLVKERYPTFKLALQDLNDPLSLLALFERLGKKPVPGRTEVPVDVIQECGRIIAEWKVWAIKTHSLRKVFLSIKGVYYECDVPSVAGGTDTVPVRWLEPWEFKQTVPSDVDFRILLTFLDLYRTLTSFVLFKLYTDENLVYPPPLDVKMDEDGEGVGKFRLVEKSQQELQGGEANASTATTNLAGNKVTKKDVKKTIRSITHAAGNSNGAAAEMEEDQDAEDEGAASEDEDFVERPSKTAESENAAPLPTYTSLLASAPTTSTAPEALLLSPYTFYLSRETSSRTWEFVIRAFGGKVVTATSAIDGPEGDSITHVIIDRPVDQERMRAMQKDRKWTWVQPQWVADCVNQGKLLPSGTGSGYEPGATLPPHLSPWDGTGEPDRPWLEDSTPATADAQGDISMVDEQVDEASDEDAEEAAAAAAAPVAELPPAMLAASLNPDDAGLVHQAELEAEQMGVAHGTFKMQLSQAVAANKASSAKSTSSKTGADEDLRKIMMSSKKQKLYEKMKYGNDTRQAEVSKTRLEVSLRWSLITFVVSLARAERQARFQAESDRATEKVEQVEWHVLWSIVNAIMLSSLFLASGRA